MSVILFPEKGEAPKVRPLSEETSRHAHSAAMRYSNLFPLFQGTGLQVTLDVPYQKLHSMLHFITLMGTGIPTPAHWKVSEPLKVV